MAMQSRISLGVFAFAALLTLSACQRSNESDAAGNTAPTNDAQAEAANPPTSPASESASERTEFSVARELSQAKRPAQAEAQLQATEGNTVEGVIRFTARADGGVALAGRVSNLTPGAHGFHIHETGDCSAPDGSSAGGHYAAVTAPHGPSNAQAGQRHTGDLGNISASGSGVADIRMIDELASLQGEHSIIGRAVVIHAGQDDLKSQPSGDAGARVACGVIRPLASEPMNATPES